MTLSQTTWFYLDVEGSDDTIVRLWPVDAQESVVAYHHKLYIYISYKIKPIA